MPVCGGLHMVILMCPGESPQIEAGTVVCQTGPHGRCSTALLRFGGLRDDGGGATGGFRPGGFVVFLTPITAPTCRVGRRVRQAAGREDWPQDHVVLFPRRPVQPY